MTWLFCRLSSNWRFSKFLKVSLFAMLDWCFCWFWSLIFCFFVQIWEIFGNAQLLRSDLYRISIPPAEIATEETIVGSEKKRKSYCPDTCSPAHLKQKNKTLREPSSGWFHFHQFSKSVTLPRVKCSAANDNNVDNAFSSTQYWCPVALNKVCRSSWSL